VISLEIVNFPLIEKRGKTRGKLGTLPVFSLLTMLMNGQGMVA